MLQSLNTIDYLNIYYTDSIQDINCQCTTKHVPKPMQLAYIECDGRRVHLCPTSVFNLVNLLKDYQTFEGEPPGRVTKHYSKFVRNLASDVHPC